MKILKWFAKKKVEEIRNPYDSDRDPTYETTSWMMYILIFVFVIGIVLMLIGGESGHLYK